jgi:hypothetical protein
MAIETYSQHISKMVAKCGNKDLVLSVLILYVLGIQEWDVECNIRGILTSMFGIT